VIANLAVAKIQTGKLRDSQLGLEKVLEKKPRDLFALTNLSIVYSKQKNFDKAVATLNQILEIDPKNAVAHNYMAVALGKTGKSAEAEDYFKRSIQLDPNYATAYFNLAIMYINSNPPQVELARQNYEKAKSLGEDPNMVFEKKLAQLSSQVAPQPTPKP
jgi:tetratricopeptide (TPR) repeat protein